jgi:hypothetical protein
LGNCHYSLKTSSDLARVTDLSAIGGRAPTWIIRYYLKNKLDAMATNFYPRLSFGCKTLAKVL